MSSDDDNPDVSASLTRKQLHILVWEKPIRHLAKAFGMPDQELTNICARFDIPRPAPGHWSKLAAGKTVETRALPPARSGMSETISMAPAPRPYAAEPETREELDFARGTTVLHVAQKLARPHPIIAGWIARREKEIRKGGQVYDRRLRRLVRPSAFTPQERRRHRMLDALLKALEAQKIAVGESERLELFATSGREKIEFQLRTKLQQVRRPLPPDEQRWRSPGDKDYKLELVETDILVFEVKGWLPGGLQRNWQDGRKGTIEAMAGDILATLLAAFPLMAAERERREKEEEERRIEAQRRYELEQQRRLEENRFRCLLEHAGRWRNAELARRFVTALRAAIPDSATVTDDRPASEWLAWAEEQAARHDPLASDPLNVLDAIAEVTNWTYRDR